MITCTENLWVWPAHKPKSLQFPINGIDCEGVVADQDFARARGWNRLFFQDEVLPDAHEEGGHIGSF